MQLVSRKRVIAVSLVLLLCLAVGLYFVLHHPQNRAQAGQYVDQFSHETVSSPAGKQPDKFGVPKNAPLYLGFDKLLNYGLTLGQIKSSETAFFKYSQALSKPVQRVSVGVDNISAGHVTTNPNALFSVSFPVQFDGSAIYQAEIDHSGLTDVQLYLKDSKSNKIVYDSGIIYSSPS